MQKKVLFLFLVLLFYVYPHGLLIKQSSVKALDLIRIYSVILNVSSFTSLSNDWINYGSTPYLSAVDYPTNYIASTVYDRSSQLYGFQNFSENSKTMNVNVTTIVSCKVYFYWKTDGSSSGIELYGYNGETGGLDGAVIGPTTSWAYYNKNVYAWPNAPANTTNRVNSFAIGFRHHYNDQCLIDYAYLNVTVDALVYIPVVEPTNVFFELNSVLFLTSCFMIIASPSIGLWQVKKGNVAEGIGYGILLMIIGLALLLGACGI